MSDEQDSSLGKPVSEADEKLLRQIRDDYKYCLDYWRENREEAAKNMDYAAADFWTQKELDKRAGRPCLSPDELSQYLKQANNNLRQNKRAVQVNPKGEGATDPDAKRRQAIIRGVEYASNAQAAYTTAFEGATEANVGYWRIVTERVKDDGYDVEPRIKRIPNLFTVLMDPNAKEADFSDMSLCFVTDVIRKSEFARKYPRARKQSFSTEDQAIAGEWLAGENILIAEYWCRVSKGKRKKLQVKSVSGDVEDVYEDELGDEKPEILNETTEEETEVIQYITNGVEILEKTEWPGSWIPIIPVLGEEIYVNQGGTCKRKFLSLISRARVPQKMLAYIASQEAEEFGMSPRAPYFLWDGQEAADEQGLATLNDVPRAYIKLKPIYAQDGSLLPPPSRIPFIPNAQAYEVSREAWRRAIQAAMGIVPLPTQAQQNNQKSGIALEKIQTAESVGSFHFFDNFDRALQNSGRQLNELITLVMDTPRQVGSRQADGTHELMVVTSQKYLEIAKKQFEVGDDDYLITDNGEFDVTISTGPSQASEREASDDFVDMLIKEGPNLNLPQPVFLQILATGVKMKNLGALGDKIAELLSPPDPEGLPPQMQAVMAQKDGQIQQLATENQALHMERAAKTQEQQTKLQVENLRQQGLQSGHVWDYITKIVMAEMAKGSKASDVQAQLDAKKELAILQFNQDSFGQAHDAAHEQAMSLMEHQQGIQQNQQQMAMQNQDQNQPGDNNA